MKWNAIDNWPPIIGRGRILLDGEPCPNVTAFDDVEGWVEALCMDGHTGCEGRAHIDPADDHEVCRVRHNGRVEWCEA